MGSMTDELYGMLQGTVWVKEGREDSKRVLEEVMETLRYGSFEEPEKLEAELWRLFQAAERGGFLAGFRYAVNLMVECWPDKAAKMAELYNGPVAQA